MRALLLALLLLGQGCSCSEDALAELETTAGDVQHDRADAIGQWESADVGLELFIGDGLRTALSSTATLQVTGAGAVHVEPETTIRFLEHAPGETAPRLSVETGEIQVNALQSGMTLVTDIGAATIVQGTQVRINSSGGRTRLEVEVGEAALVRGAESVQISAGQGLEVEVGAATIETPLLELEPEEPPENPYGPEEDPTPEDPGANPTETEPGQPEPSPDPGEGPTPEEPSGLPTARRPPRYSDPGYNILIAEAGSSFTVRDPAPPTAIGLRAAACSEEGELQFLRSGGQPLGGPLVFRGSSVVNVLLPPRRHRYRLRCGGETFTGSIRVLRDSGRRRLPTTAPASIVDTDGRNYTILYQTHLPEVRVRWDDAPASAQLRIRSGGQQRTVPGRSGRVTLSSGELHEGTHELTFEAGARRSPTTTVRIRFDNAASSASIRAPEEGTFRPGSPTPVAGTALPGWHVRVGATEIPLDGQGRFEAQIPTSPSQRGIAIWVSAPGRRATAYIRHGAGG